MDLIITFTDLYLYLHKDFEMLNLISQVYRANIFKIIEHSKALVIPVIKYVLTMEES